MTSPHPESEAMLFLPSAIVRLIGTFHCLDPRPAALAANSLMAERVGFEPTDRVNDQRFSRPPHSTTLAPLPFHERRASPARLIRRLHRMAERVGFEPTVEFPLHTLSRRAPSATRTPLHIAILASTTGLPLQRGPSFSFPFAAARQRTLQASPHSAHGEPQPIAGSGDSDVNPARYSPTSRSIPPWDPQRRTPLFRFGC